MDGKEEDCTEARAPQEDVLGADADEPVPEARQDPLYPEAEDILTAADQDPSSELTSESVDPLKELEDDAVPPGLSIEPGNKSSEPPEEHKEKPAEGMELEKVVSADVEPMELEEPEEKAVEQQLDSVCQLEEELKRLHGGESEEEPKPEKPENVEGALKSLLEDEDDLKPETKIEEAKRNEKPIMKDSDLEEMLSADDVIKDPGLIKASQEDLKTTDVLVCGRCHEVFHFVEEFRSHKSQMCKAKSSIVPVCEGELKPQIWGFTLWKNKLIGSLKPNEAVPTSWVTYQKWCKLPPIDKNTWISAGQTLQYCSRIGAMKIIDESNKENSVDNSLMKVTRSVIVHDKPTDPNANTALRTHSMESKEFAVERIVAKRFNPKKKYWEYQIKWEHFSNEENTWEPVTNLTHCKQMVEEFEAHLKRLKMEKAKQQQQAIATNTPIMKKKVPVPSSSVVDYTPGRPQRTSKQKALNQVKAWCGNISDDDMPSSLKRKMDNDSDDSFEKKLKLEDYSDDSDDQKPVSMSKAPTYRKIAPKPSPVQLVRNGMDKMSPLPQNVLIPDANGVVRINQKQLPSLSTGVYIMSKTAGIIKLDSATSKVATSGGQTIVKVAPKIGQTQIKIVKKDGSSTTTTKQLLQTNTKQMGMTTTKVYKPIITKVKKPSEIDTQKKTEMMKKLNDIAKRNPELGQKSMKLSGDSSKKDSVKIMDFSDVEDNDDGIEDVPFPEEIKVPEPDSPHDFTLDPFTGKLAGVEYPEVPEQDPLPDPEPTEEAKSDSSLDNIVKLAAADITEEDLKNEPADVNLASLQSQQEDDEEEGEKQSGEKKQTVVKTEPSGQPQTKTIIRMPMGISQYKSKTATSSSILNKVLTGTPIIRRQPGPAPVPRMQQKLLNQSVSRAPLNSIVRVGNTTYVRKSIPKSRHIPGAKLIKAQHDSATGKSVYTYSRPVMQSVTRKIGDTTIKSATGGAAPAVVGGTPSRSTLIAQRPVASSGAIGTPRPQTRIIQSGGSSLLQQKTVSPRREMPIIRHQLVEKKVSSMGVKMAHRPQAMMGGQQKPKQVISMPSLLDDDPETDSNIQLAKVTTPPPEMSPTTSAIMEHAQPLGEATSSSEAHTATESTEEGIEGQGATPVTDLSSFTLADNDNPIFITGDDGTVYQVAGQNEQGQTILLTQGSDGQQQCLLVTSETAEAMEHVNAEEQQQQAQQEIQRQGDDIAMPEIGGAAASVTEPLSVKTDQDTNDQVVAQVVRAEPPSPGGTHKVVVMLPDGNLMVTQVSPEEYASLELE